MAAPRYLAAPRGRPRRRGALLLVVLGVALLAPLGCRRAQPSGCTKLHAARARCDAVYHPREEFVRRCQRVLGQPEAEHLRAQIRCAGEAGCPAYRRCVAAERERRQRRPGAGMAPPLYRALRPATASPGP